MADDVRVAQAPPARVVDRRLIGGATAAAPCAVVMLLVVGLAWRERGSILPVDWGLYAIAAPVLLLTVVVAGLPRRPSRLAAVGGIALLGLGIWAAVTATWSPVPESARDEALLTVLYAVVFAIGVCVGWTREAARTGVAVVAATSALLTLAVAVRVLRSGDVSGLYWDGRLATPISYPNALASVLVLGYWPGIGAATARSVHPLLRGCAGAVATATLSGWLMTQSKGAAIGLAVSGVVFFAVAPRRLAALIPTAITTVLVAASYGPLTRTFRASAGALTDAASTAATTTLVLTAVGGAAVAAFAYAESRTTVSPRTTRVAGVVVGAAAAIVAIAAIGAFLVRHDRPIAYVQHEWRAFKHQPAHEQGSSHLLTIGSNRYDTWRVALRDAQHHPIGGVGARGFSVSYPLHGRTQETPRRSHSVELDLLGEEGVVGLALFVAAIGLPLAAVLRRTRTSLLHAGVLAATVSWLVHASGDWIWTFPASGVGVFLLLGLGAAEDRGELRTGARGALAVAAVVIALLAFAPVWLAARFTRSALEQRRPHLLTWAKRLDPVSVAPLLAEADLDPNAATSALARAVRREPRRSELHFQYALALERAGRRADARRELEAARRLAPHDQVIAAALRRVGT